MSFYGKARTFPSWSMFLVWLVLYVILTLLGTGLANFSFMSMLVMIIGLFISAAIISAVIAAWTKQREGLMSRFLLILCIEAVGMVVFMLLFWLMGLMGITLFTGHITPA